MPSPAISLYHDDSSVGGGTPLDNTHPIDFGALDKGLISATITIHVWNGKGDGSVATAVGPRLYALNGADDVSAVFNGTTYNGGKSMLEARSCAAYGVAADQQRAWTPISPTGVLMLGDMPANTMRTVELRMNIPIDAPDMALKSWTIRVSA